MINRALFCGAGISAGSPVGLPLAQDLHNNLCKCFFDAARVVAPEYASIAGFNQIKNMPLNVIARLAVTAGRSTAEELLNLFRVMIPNEAHMLAAVHAMLGSLLLTPNFDDGIERAYGLLEGSVHLPSWAAHEYHNALKNWRAMLQPMTQLSIVASSFSSADYSHRPLLVKLRGCRQQGWHRSLVPLHPSVRFERHRLTEPQMIAMRAAAESEHLAIAGFSGADVDCREALFSLLHPGHFSWTAKALKSELVDRVQRLDPAQPMLRPAVEGVRASLPHADELPHWPDTSVANNCFESAFEQWAAKLPLNDSAVVYSQLLAASGLFEEAESIRSVLRSPRRVLASVKSSE